MEAGKLVRADSWELPGLATGPQMLKTVSNAQEAVLGCAPPAPQGAPGPACPIPSGKPPLPPAPSTASTWTQAGAGSEPPREGSGQQPYAVAAQHPQQQGGSSAGLLMRQVSLDAIAGSGDLCRPDPVPVPDRSSIFNDVIEQLAAKEESLPVQTGLYTLPSIQFLESLLEDMDSKTASTGQHPADPPLYLPLDVFDLPFDDGKLQRPPLGPSPFDMAPHGGSGHPQMYHIHAAATLQQPVAPPHPHAFIPTSNSMPLLGHPAMGFQGSSQLPHCRSAGPSPTKPVRRAASAYGAFEYDDLSEMTLQASKSGRVRKVASFAGTKRKVSDARGSDIHMHGNAVSESDTGATTLDDESDEEVSKGSKAGRKHKGSKGSSKNKGGKRTTCLNCGCHQTPQWRCGPLGPRTLCNACGVRYKKGLPLNCWPIREGMVLPPGAVLPPGVHIPGIILQPAEDE